MEGMPVKKMWLTCNVYPGQFPSEYAISGSQHDGATFSLFAPASFVRGPESGSEGDGHILVEVVKEQGELALVRLPAQTFENGHHVTVHSRDLVPSPPAQHAIA
jgi:hypothetical protein